MTDWNRNAAVKRGARVLALVDQAERKLACLRPRPDECVGRRSDGRPQFKQVLDAEADLAQIRRLLLTPVRIKLRRLERVDP